MVAFCMPIIPFWICPDVLENRFAGQKAAKTQAKALGTEEIDGAQQERGDLSDGGRRCTMQRHWRCK